MYITYYTMHFVLLSYSKANWSYGDNPGCITGCLCGCDYCTSYFKS